MRNQVGMGSVPMNVSTIADNRLLVPRSSNAARTWCMSDSGSATVPTLQGCRTMFLGRGGIVYIAWIQELAGELPSLDLKMMKSEWAEGE
jgi:hypothetical protein